MSCIVPQQFGRCMHVGKSNLLSTQAVAVATTLRPHSASYTPPERAATSAIRHLQSQHSSASATVQEISTLAA